MCESRREPGAGREPRGNRRLSVARAMHEPTRSESEGEPSGGMATQKATSQLNLESGEVELAGDTDFAAFAERAVGSVVDDKLDSLEALRKLRTDVV